LLPQPFSEPKFQMHLIGGLSRHVPFFPLPPDDQNTIARTRWGHK
jgi:hypothetical protein